MGVGCPISDLNLIERLKTHLGGLSDAGFSEAEVYENSAEDGILWKAASIEGGSISLGGRYIAYDDASGNGYPTSQLGRCIKARKAALVDANQVTFELHPDSPTRRGPVLIVPLVSGDTTETNIGIEPVGLFVAFSSVDHPRSLTDTKKLSPRIEELCALLTNTRRDRELRCHQEALQLLSDVTIMLSQEMEAGRTSSGPARAVGDAPMGTRHELSEIRHALQNLVEMLLSKYDLTRCAILAPSKDYPESWTLFTRAGFPNDAAYDHKLYAPGDGLTGRVFSCKPDEIILSDDLESDHRWSQKFSDKFRDSNNDNEPTSFIGVPIFSNIKGGSNRPYGALICMRRGHHPSGRGPFRGLDKLFLQNIASSIAFSFDTTRWRRELQTREVRQLHIKRVWSSQRSEQQMYTVALRLLKQELPSKRLLLAVVDHDRPQILGKATIGFHESLIDETVRLISEVKPEDPRQEDILARICRQRIRFPFVVDPTAESDEYAINVNIQTRVKHRVTNRLLLIPLVGYRGDIVGVVLSELSSRVLEIPSKERSRIALFASQLASLIELNTSRAGACRDLRMIQQLLQTFEQSEGDNGPSDRRLAALLAVICREYRFEHGLIYRYDEKNHVLEGAVGYRVNTPALRETTYSVDSDQPTDFTKDSLARTVYFRRDFYFVPIMDGPPVDAEDRDRVGIDSSLAAWSVPLIYDNVIYGVMILCTLNRTPPSARSTERLMAEGGILALAMAVGKTTNEFMVSRRVAASREVIIRQIGMITAHVGEGFGTLKTIASQDREMLNAIARDAANLFSAALCGIYVADEVVSIPLQAPDRGIDPRRYIGDRRFRLRAGSGYAAYAMDETSDRNRTYGVYEKGLTSIVLGTLEPATTGDVEGDDRWSGRRGNSDHDFPCGQLRSWMGVPLLIRSKDRQYLFGAITFTRLRRFERDTRSFGESDLAAAEDIAWLISLALYNKHQVGLVSHGLRQMLSAFRHGSLIDPLTEVRDSYPLKILELIRPSTLDGPTKTAITELTKHIRATASFVLSGFDAYGNYLGEKVTWNAKPKPIQPIAQSVVPFVRQCPEAAGVDVRDPVVTPKDLKCSVDEAKFRFILYALLHNGVRACAKHSESNKRVDTWIEVKDNNLLVIVQDTGRGIAANEHEDIFEPGVSGFGSSGLGLAMVRRFVEASTNGERRGSVNVQSDAGLGAKFIVTLPLDPVER